MDNQKINCMVIRDKERGTLTKTCELTNQHTQCYEVLCIYDNGDSSELFVNEQDAIKFAAKKASYKKRRR